MTRINVVPVEELSDQWLLAEYRELPRCIKQNINTDDAPQNYCLGKGHMKWAKHHTLFLISRFHKIFNELKFRGFNPLFNPEELANFAKEITKESDKNAYLIFDEDIDLNRSRLIERYNEKSNFYRWTNRSKPNYIKLVDNVKTSTFKFLNGKA